MCDQSKPEVSMAECAWCGEEGPWTIEEGSKQELRLCSRACQRAWVEDDAGCGCEEEDDA